MNNLFMKKENSIQIMETSLLLTVRSLPMYFSIRFRKHTYLTPLNSDHLNDFIRI